MWLYWIGSVSKYRLGLDVGSDCSPEPYHFHDASVLEETTDYLWSSTRECRLQMYRVYNSTAKTADFERKLGVVPPGIFSLFSPRRQPNQWMNQMQKCKYLSPPVNATRKARETASKCVSTKVSR